MAGMIEGIFGIMPSDVRAAELQQQQEQAQALIKTGQASPFAATFGTAFGAGLSKGLLSRLGLETPEMEKAKANQEQAQMFVEEYKAADTPEKLEEVKLKLMARGAPESTINMIDRRIETVIDRNKPVAPAPVTKQQIERYTNTISKAAERFGIDIGDLPDDDKNAFYNYVMGKTNAYKASIATANKRGAGLEEPLTDDILNDVVAETFRDRLLQEKDKKFTFGLAKDTTFDMPYRQPPPMIDKRSNEIYNLTLQEQE